VIAGDFTVPHRLGVTAALALAVIAAQGCGSSSSSNATQKPSATSAPTSTTSTTTTTASAAPTKAEFIAKADAICKEARANTSTTDEVKAALAALQANETAANRARYAKALRAQAKYLTATREKLQALEPPPEDRVTVSNYLEAGGTAISLAQSLATAVESRDVARITPLVDELNTKTTKAKGIAQGYGFKVCGSG
jgi:hypothetical protein